MEEKATLRKDMRTKYIRLSRPHHIKELLEDGWKLEGEVNDPLPEESHELEQAQEMGRKEYVAALKELGVKHHHSLGVKKLKALYDEHKE